MAIVKLRRTVIKGDHFQDEDTGRSIGIRGINLSGSCKLPKAIHSSKEVCSEISFKDRPFPLEEAHEHLTRLAYWGLSVIRLLVPWEALEPYASGKYDEEYIEYLIELLKLFPKYGLQAIIDPHQDVWSRATGGSGNPIWTLDAAGLNPENFLQTYAASNQFRIKIRPEGGRRPFREVGWELCPTCLFYDVHLIFGRA
ncbi:hypothetical protein DSO57_1034517 [Entomophthora muscae]|uniref:Uncharacterized protein n=1 Tax=Entomophthora muscae TaxID=34485 RepID=A0ACC2REJ8_9FUNG|nr:hypothetical protein DSO57_1034517 [Entomophthora muscae]